MTKINREEYDILKGLEDTWKWIARDNKGCCKKLKAHASRPYKMVLHWSSGDIMLQLLEGESLFQFVQWGDEEPYNISELIEEYDNWLKDYEVDWNKLFGREDSEEAEVLRMHDSKETEYELTRDFLNLLEVMHRIEDDSETKRIYPVGGDEGGRPVNYDFCFEFDRHGNFIDLKKEKVNLTLYGELEEDSDDDKIEVPKWFNEWYEDSGHKRSLYGALNELYGDYESGMEDWSGKYDNPHAELQEDICRIFMGGQDVYRVEEKTVYNVYFVDEIKHGERVGFFLYRDDEGIHMDTRLNNYMSEHPSCRLTEDEIKTYSEPLWDLAIENKNLTEDYYYIKRLDGDKNYFKSANGGDSWGEKNEADRILGHHRANYLVNNLSGSGVHKVKI